MTIGFRLGILENHNARTHQGVCELKVLGPESMDMHQVYVLKEIALDGFAIIDVHELAGNEPTRESFLLQPSGCQHQEIAVESGEA